MVSILLSKSEFDKSEKNPWTYGSSTAATLKGIVYIYMFTHIRLYVQTLFCMYKYIIMYISMNVLDKSGKYPWICGFNTAHTHSGIVYIYVDIYMFICYYVFIIKLLCIYL
jgi:hypothetical protein